MSDLFRGMVRPDDPELVEPVGSFLVGDVLWRESESVREWMLSPNKKIRMEPIYVQAGG